MKFLNLKTMAEALEIIRNNTNPLADYEICKLSAAGGRCIAEDIFSREDYPAFYKSTVDGYALQAAETNGASDSIPAFFTLVEEVEIGENPRGISGGETSYVPTGAVLPEGADAVVMLEYSQDSKGEIQIFSAVSPGENIVEQGDDFCTGDLLLKKGTIIDFKHICLLAAVGEARVKVKKKPKIRIISTGDELEEIDKKILTKGRIRDTNSLSLAYMCEKLGGEVLKTSLIKDDYKSLLTETEQALKEADFIILSGGSSVGKKDYTKDILEEIGKKKLLIEGIAVKPGKPTLFTTAANKPILGLPGHPLAAMMLFRILGSEIIERLTEQEKKANTLSATLKKNVPGGAGYTNLVRVKLFKEEKEFFAEPIFSKSVLLRGLRESDGFLLLDEEKEGYLQGTKVEIFPW